MSASSEPRRAAPVPVVDDLSLRDAHPPLDPQALARDLGRFQVVDVRFPNEWEAGRIGGAVHLPLADLANRAKELDRARPVVTVCRSGSRSAKAVKELAGEGFDVRSLEGGLAAWVAQGQPIVAADGGPGTLAEPDTPADDRPEHM